MLVAAAGLDCDVHFSDQKQSDCGQRQRDQKSGMYALNDSQRSDHRTANDGRDHYRHALENRL